MILKCKALLIGVSLTDTAAFSMPAYVQETARGTDKAVDIAELTRPLAQNPVGTIAAKQVIKALARYSPGVT